MPSRNLFVQYVSMALSKRFSSFFSAIFCARHSSTVRNPGFHLIASALVGEDEDTDIDGMGHAIIDTALEPLDEDAQDVEEAALGAHVRVALDDVAPGQPGDGACLKVAAIATPTSSCVAL